MGTRMSGFRPIYKVEHIKRGHWVHRKDAMNWEFSELYYWVYSPEEEMRARSYTDGGPAS